jgi:hypothetical protein
MNDICIDLAVSAALLLAVAVSGTGCTMRYQTKESVTELSTGIDFGASMTGFDTVKTQKSMKSSHNELRD